VSNVGSNERSGLPLPGQGRRVSAGSAAAEGIDMRQPAPGGLPAWLRISDGAWVGRVSYVVVMTDVNDQEVRRPTCSRACGDPR
jgi:hypothetical protein